MKGTARMHYILRSERHLYSTVSLSTPLPLPFWLDGEPLDFPVPPLEFSFTRDPGASWIDYITASSIPLLSDRMRAALEGCGVDNIDYYPASVRDTKSGERRTYHAANVIGLVECVDRACSKFIPFDETSILIDSFDRLVLNEAKIDSFKLFRAAEHCLLLLADGSVKTRLEAAGLHGLLFIEPEQWDGFLT